MPEKSLGPAAERLARRLREAREQARPTDGSPPTQRWLAETCQRNSQQISSFENGREIPGKAALHQLFVILCPEGGPSLLSEWLADWMMARAEREKPDDSPELNQALELVERSLSRGSRGAPGPLCSLADFPGGEPLTVILGDRREPRAKSVADCLIYSGSTTDAMYLTGLAAHMENVAIRSDKLLVRMPVDYLESMPEVANRNLLIIGSPAANWGARILNTNDAVFPFRIDEDVVQRDDAFRADDRMQDDSFAGYLGDLLPSAHSEELLQKKAMELRNGIPEENEDLRLVQTAVELAQRVLGGSTAKAMMNKFRSMGIVDPADQEHHAQITYGSNDFAVVTLARNPWSRDGRYRAVVCGGIHGPGTAAALRELLTRPERFENHPLGAVLEVKLRLDLDWPTRFDRATVSFQTQEYRTQDVLAHLEAAIAAKPEKRAPVFRQMPEASLRSRAEFVRSVLATTA